MDGAERYALYCYNFTNFVTLYGSVFVTFHSENPLPFPSQAVEVVVSYPTATDGADAEATTTRQKEANRKALAALLDETKVN